MKHKVVSSSKIKYFKAAVLLVSLAVIASAFCFALSTSADLTAAECNCGNDPHTSDCPYYTTANISAKLYQNASYTGSSYDLMAEPTSYVWNYDKARYLRVALSNMKSSLSPGEHYRLVITMDRAVYSPSINTYSSDSSIDCTITKNAAIPVNVGGSYKPSKGTSAVVSYDIDSGINDYTFQMSLAYDWVLWDGYSDTEIGYDRIYNGDAAASLVKVELVKIIDSDTFATVDSGDLPTATSGKNDSLTSGGSLMTSPNADGSDMTPSKELTPGQKARYRLNYPTGRLYKEYVVKIVLPAYTHPETGVEYFFEYDEALNSIKAEGGTADFSAVTATENGKKVLTLTFRNFYTKQSHLVIGVKLNAGTELDDVAPVNFPRANVSHYVNGRSTAKSTGLANDVTVYPAGKAYISQYYFSTSASVKANAVSLLSFFSVKNSGGTKSDPVTYLAEFDTDNTNTVGVTAVKLPMPLGTHTIYYTMVDESGILTVANGSVEVEMTGSSVKEGYLFSRANLSDEQKSYYFKSIRYVMEIPPNTPLYYSDSTRTNGGGVWGKLLVNDLPPVESYPNMHYYIYEGAYSEGISGDAEALIDYKVQVPLNERPDVPYGIDSLSVSDNTIVAGEKTVISARAFVYNYPYSSKMDINNIRFGILLPKGIAVVRDEIKAWLPALDNAPVEVTDLTYQEYEVEGTEQIFWIIKLDPSAMIGFYSDMLGVLESGSKLNIDIPIQTSNSTAADSLIINDRLYVGGLNQPNTTASGTISNYKTTDVYDITGDGIVTGQSAGRMDVTKSTVYIHITPPAALLEIDDSLSISGSGATGDVLISKSKNDVFKYRLSVACTSGGTAKEFFYFIPIPKAGNNGFGDFVSNGNGLTLNLNSPVTITAQNAHVSDFRVLYATATNLNYSTAQSYTEWKDAAEIADLKDITLVKIALADPNDILENGDIITLDVEYKLDESTDFAKNAGTSVTWGSKGHYVYTFGGTTNSGDRATEGGTVKLNHTAAPHFITLTAAKGGNPNTGSKIVEISLYEVLGHISGFALAHNFDVTNVKTSALTLVDSSDAEFDAMSSSESNQKFKITAKFASGAANTLMQAGITSFGSVAASNAASPSIKFEIFNGDLLTDNITSRYVSFDLVSDNGLTIPITIHVARELTPATPGTPGIIEGISYMLSEDDDTTVNVSSDSAVTARFVTEFIHKNYSCPSLKITSLTEGKRIIMIDWTNSSDPEYYYAEMASSISLESFKSITDQESYVYDLSIETSIKHTWVFIIDLSGSDLTAGENVQLELVSGNETFPDQSLSLTAKESRSFTLESGTSTLNLGDTFNLTYGSHGELSGDADYRYSNKGLSLVVRGEALPADFYLLINGESYYRKADGNFIIPLDSAQGQGGTLRVTPVSSSLVSRATLNFEIWISATEDETKPYSGIKTNATATVTVAPTSIEPSFRIISLSDRFITPDELKNNLTFVIELNDLPENSSVKLYAQHKIGNGYVDDSTIILTVTDSIGDGRGEFTLDSSKRSFVLSLNQALKQGTYRLRLVLDDGEGEPQETFIGFVVGE